MFRVKILIILVYICFLTNVLAQEDDAYFFGQLVDVAQNEPVPFASIRIKDQPLGVISNQDGTFKIPSRYKYLGEIVEISCMGYRTKEISVSDFVTGKANIIVLAANDFELTEVVVSAKIKKLNAQQIVKIAVNSIPQNHPQKPFELVGYYRDFQIRNTEYVNLNEAILKVFDKGFTEKYNLNNNYQLLSFKNNLDFKVDSFTKQPYDYEKQNKIIPNAKMENVGGNEFISLIIHDAIRNYQIKSYSFIEDMASDFIENHRFVLKGKTNYKSEVVYEIECFYRNKDYYSEGKIFIGKSDFAIHKLDYALFKRKKPGEFDTAINAEERFSNGFNKTKKELIYRIITEYGKDDKDNMFLKYISFYNKMLVQRPAEFKSKFVLDLDTKRFVIRLSRMPANVDDIKNKDFRIKYKDKLLPIERIRFFEDAREFRITPHYLKKETGPILEYLFTENEKLEVSDLTYEYDNIKDSLGNKLDEKKYEYLHQYREFFTQETIPNSSVSISKDSLMLKDTPLDSKLQPICSECNSSDYWMNTPLQNSFQH